MISGENKWYNLRGGRCRSNCPCPMELGNHSPGSGGDITAPGVDSQASDAISAPLSVLHETKPEFGYAASEPGDFSPQGAAQIARMGCGDQLSTWNYGAIFKGVGASHFPAKMFSESLSSSVASSMGAEPDREPSAPAIFSPQEAAHTAQVVHGDQLYQSMLRSHFKGVRLITLPTAQELESVTSSSVGSVSMAGRDREQGESAIFSPHEAAQAAQVVHGDQLSI